MFAAQVAAAFADAAAALDIRGSAAVASIRDELQTLLTDPFDGYLRHPNWPTGVSLSGVPFEFTLTIDPQGIPTLGYRADLTDHRVGLVGNWQRYENAVQTLLGAAQQRQVDDLFRTHLDGLSPLIRTPVQHGVTYLPAASRRVRLTFSTRGWTDTQLAVRCPTIAQGLLPEGTLPVPGEQVWVAYEFANTDTSAMDTHLFVAPRVSARTQSFAEIVGPYPDLAVAAAVFAQFQPFARETVGTQSVVLQMSDTHAGTPPRAQLLFRCLAWGWEQPARLAELCTYLADAHAVPLRALHLVLGVCAASGITLRPSFVTIGPGTSPPAVAFAFCPVADDHDPEITPPARFPKAFPARRDASPVPPGMIEDLLAGGLAFLENGRNADGAWSDFSLDAPDGYWVDYPLTGPSDEWVTAYIAAILTSDSARARECASPALAWLRARYRPGHGWGWNRDTAPDADTTALALRALHQMDGSVPDGAPETLARYRLDSGGYHAYADWEIDTEHGNGAADITASVLRAQLALDADAPAKARDTILTLIAQQREEGGWNAFWWQHDLFATYRAVQALNAVMQCVRDQPDCLPASVVRATERAIYDARPSISAQAIPRSPYLLGLWLSSWLAAHGSVHYPSVERMVRHLRAQQQPDGRWLTVPLRRIARTKLLRPWARSDSGKLSLDPACLVTTATVVEGLLALQSARNSASF